jgi:hypothetical protein
MIEATTMEVFLPYFLSTKSNAFMVTCMRLLNADPTVSAVAASILLPLWKQCAFVDVNE